MSNKQSLPGADLADLLYSRYGAAAPEIAGTVNEAVATMLAHRSVRRFSDTPLPDGTLELLIAAAQSAATSSNLQTWSVVAVDDPARREKLAELGNNQRYIRQAPLYLVWLADLSRLADTADAHELPREGLDYLEMFLMASIDAALAAQNAALAAESLGLGIVYIGAMRNHPEEIAATLDLPPMTVAVFGMCIGYPDPDRSFVVKPRLPISAVLHRDTYRRDQSEQVAAYVDVMHTFYREQQMQASNWAEHSARRIAGPEQLTGRHRLVEALRNLGFPLK
jgi:nitroreductase